MSNDKNLPDIFKTERNWPVGKISPLVLKIQASDRHTTSHIFPENIHSTDYLHGLDIESSPKEATPSLRSNSSIVNQYWVEAGTASDGETQLIFNLNTVKTEGSIRKNEIIRSSNLSKKTQIYPSGLREEIKQVWLGTIVDFDARSITARLEDYSDDDYPDEEVSLLIEEIEEQDRELIEKGAQFYWHIGYRFGRNHPRERFSKIRFRRLAKWEESELLEAEKIAKEYLNFFSQNSNIST